MTKVKSKWDQIFKCLACNLAYNTCSSNDAYEHYLEDGNSNSKLIN